MGMHYNKLKLMARPTVMTPTVVRKLEEAFALGCTDLEASLYANIAPATLYNHQDKNPQFLERKEQLKMMPVLRARTALVKSLDKDPILALKYLERKKKDEFSPRRENDITTNGNDLTITNFRSLSDEKLDALIERISLQQKTVPANR